MKTQKITTSAKTTTDIKDAFKVALKKSSVQTQGKIGGRQGCVSS